MLEFILVARWVDYWESGRRGSSRGTWRGRGRRGGDRRGVPSLVGAGVVGREVVGMGVDSDRRNAEGTYRGLMRSKLKDGFVVRFWGVLVEETASLEV
jgi:hypothetical protein